jgi:type I restriction enzyme S subunit
MSLTRYAKYKNSGVLWLGEVPEHWHVHSIRHHLKVIFSGLVANQIEPSDNTVPVTRIETISKGVIDREKLGYISIEDARSDRMLLKGDILFSNINSLNMIGNCARYNGGDVIYAGMNLLVLRPASSVNSHWLFWLIRSPMFRKEIESLAKPAINQASIPQGSILSIMLATPTLQEQSFIAAFLDRETGKIDALIAEQEKLLALLAEKRQATISHAVTKGLNPAALMKDSGVEWLGEVPAHWAVCAVRRVLNHIEQGWSPECYNRPAVDGEWGVLKTGCVNLGIFEEGNNKALPEQLEPVAAYEVQKGDLLMSRASGSPELVGSVAYVRQTRPKLMLSDKIFRLHFTGTVASEFMAALFNSRSMRTQIEQAISGAEGLANNLPQSSLKRFWIAVPPIAEQSSIISYLDLETAKLDALTTEATRAKALLKERRTALISAAVTGKIDVRPATLPPGFPG